MWVERLGTRLGCMGVMKVSAVSLQIPGRWQVFIDQLQSSALEDCAAFYESDIHMLLSSYENSAVNETELLVGVTISNTHWYF